MATRSHGLSIAAQAGAALGPEQRKYNQLVARIEKARSELLAWQEQVPLFAQAHAARLQPLLAELAAQRRQLVLALAGLLAQTGWRKAERRILRRALCEQAAELVDSDFIDEAAAAELAALHDQHAETSLDETRREALDDMKGMFEAVSGLDLGGEAFESEEELLQHAQQRLQAEAERQAQQQEQAQAQPRRRQSAAQRKRQAQEEQASKSVREVYRQLASALHPDRAEDEADRLRRTALMQRVNQAYSRQDLLALFALQLETEQIDPAHLARASAERLRHYNYVLSAQLAELQDEVEMQVTTFGMDYGIEPWRRLNPHKLGPLLDDSVRQSATALHRVRRELQQIGQPAGARRWLQQERNRQKLDDEDPFGLPF
jgi:hypothetical protein